MKKTEAIKRNNILAYILFALSVPFPIMYIAYLIFLKDYTILFESLPIWADVLNVIMLGICTALLIFKDKSAGKPAKIMLGLSLIILPVSRSIMIEIMIHTYMLDTFTSILFLALIIEMIFTAFVYIKAVWARVFLCILLAVTMSYSAISSFPIHLFIYEKKSDICEITAPDNIHSIRVIEYESQNRTTLMKVVYAYNSVESFSVGPVEFVKDWYIIDDYKEETRPLDENTQITFPDNETVKLQDEIYTYDGKRVADGKRVTEP